MLPERKNSGQRRIMTDSDFLELFNKRDEAAINAVAGQYGAYLRTIALNILGDEGESEECVNDALFSVWNRVPPEQPRNMRAYIAAAVRNAALDRYKQKHRLKRIPSEYTTSLEELAGCIDGGKTVEEETDAKELSAVLSAFIRSLPERERLIFMSRYYHYDSVREIAGAAGEPELKVYRTLKRLREKLRAALEERELL